MQDLVCVDNIISVHFNKEQDESYYRWVPVKRYLVRKTWYNFWSPKIEIAEGGYYNGLENIKLKELDDYLQSKYPGRYKFKKNASLNEGPLGTLFQRAYVHVKTLGGKYTQSYCTYYNSDEEALAAIAEIEKQYPGKFMVIR